MGLLNKKLMEVKKRKEKRRNISRTMGKGTPGLLGQISYDCPFIFGKKPPKGTEIFCHLDP